MRTSKSNKKLQWVLVFIGLTALIIGIQFIPGKDKPLTHNKKLEMNKQEKEPFPEFPDHLRMNTYDEVVSFYEKRIPGLKRAKEHQLTTFPKQSIDLPNQDGKLYINELWFNGRDLHILYSIDREVFGKNPVEMPFAFESMQIKPLGEKGGLTSTSYSLYSQNLGSGKVLFNHKLYGTATMGVIFEEGLPDHSIDETILASFNMHLPNGFYKIESIPLPLHYANEKDYEKTYAIQGRYKKQGIMIEPTKFIYGISHNKVELKIRANQGELTPIIIGSIVSAEGESRPLQFLKEIKNKKDVYTVETPPFSKDASSFTLDIKGIHLRRKQDFSLTVDISDYENSQANKPLRR
ncbi:hypothetical protein MUN89_00140 [Halobacillus salinarum]|uniref:Uncharacterized protein n=1 Tax=Halobacillus salinarum TaxID=2932257 RepID=A0ABY4ELC0_9BACI|nr:hypothetical protein [Halobacillus salinarum]UOQ44444.1 hypothetical protein MUN89_00140 [Halobacillus salinarum]